MRTASSLVLIAGLSQPMTVSAAETVAHFRLAADRQNASVCNGLDAVLSRVHTVTVRNGDVELTSAGGIEGRMSELKAGLYRIVFELEGKRVDAVADLAATPNTLTVTERNRPCRWLAGAQ
jgi:hypothetical protein